MPFHKSFADFAIFYTLHLSMGLPPMFTFTCDEDTPKIELFDKWLSSCGVVMSKRSEDQSMSTYYLQSSLLKETIEHNQVTMIYQNNQRIRSGKLNRKVTADMSVRWILEAFLNLNKMGKNIVVVPIMLNYDRIWEGSNLSIEMVSGKRKEYNLFTALTRMLSISEDSLGQVYVKYLDPIDLKTYLGYELQT